MDGLSVLALLMDTVSSAVRRREESVMLPHNTREVSAAILERHYRLHVYHPQACKHQIQSSVIVVCTCTTICICLRSACTVLHCTFVDA